MQAQKLNLLLEKSNRDLDQFAYVASHDLKAPLRGIANLASWIEDDLSTSMTPATQEKLELLRGRVLRMEALIEGILTYSRAGRVRENLQMVDVALLVADVLELSPPPPEVAVEVGSLPTFATEKVELQQVFMNLLSNAFKHARKAGARVTVTARDQPAGWQFAVTDNGPGIDSKYQTRIFGIFQTLASRDKVEGTGIGLAVVKKLVEGRGGHVWVESQPGAGATFLFTWPERTRGQDAA